jgi:protein arginine kinase
MSRLEEVTGKALSRWMEVRGPESDTVISSRIRLARNIEGLPFPHFITSAQARDVVGRVGAALGSPQAAGLGLADAEVYHLDDLPLLDRHVLVEKHLISPSLAQSGEKGAVVIGAGEAVSIMVNEEDHVRLQCLFPGLQLGEALALANKIDDLLEEQLGYAFSERYGYLTACPTNVGTGMRASAMIHLPALVINNAAGRVLSTVVKLGFIVRGLYGEGTEAIGNVFQISNQVTLGQTEADTVQNLQNVVEQVIAKEKQAREALLSEMRPQIEDKVGRAHGILLFSHILSSQEAMQLLSDLRLGVETGLVKGIDPRILNELLVAIRPGYLQRLAGRDLDPAERDGKRADLMRMKLSPALASPDGGAGRSCR